MSHVDTTSPITHVSLCAGYGGIDLGLRRVLPTLRTIAYSEREGFCCANLVSKIEAGLLDAAPIWTDVKTFPWSEFHGCVDILSGGYPCQPFSAAGKRLGAEDPRHLWPHISAGIAAMRPGVCFFENVEGHISLGLPDVIEDLAGMGYRTTWGIFSASEVGAPHQRKRIFILAHCQSKGLEGYRRLIANGVWDDAGPSGANTVLANAQCTSLAGWRVAEDMAQAQGSDEGQGLQRQRMRDTADHCGAAPWPSRPGEPQFEWEPPRVVVDAKGQRADRRLDVCDEERRPRPALQSESDNTGREGGTMGHTGSQRCEQDTALRSEQQPSGVGEKRGAGTAEAMGNATQLRRTGLREDNAAIIAKQLVESTNASGRQTQPCLGDLSHGTGSGLCGPNVSGLSDQELAEICEWMVTSTNRTDSLRLLGNGVVPATAERAFRILVGELRQLDNA